MTPPENPVCGKEGRRARAGIRSLLNEQYPRGMDPKEVVNHILACGICVSKIKNVIENNPDNTTYLDTPESTIEAARENIVTVIDRHRFRRPRRY